MQLFSADATILFKNIKLFFAPENMKKTLSKVAHNRPKLFFSVLPTGPKPAQISDIFHRNLPPRDFSIMTLRPYIKRSLFSPKTRKKDTKVVSIK